MRIPGFGGGIGLLKEFYSWFPEGSRDSKTIETDYQKATGGIVCIRRGIWPEREDYDEHFGFGFERYFEGVGS